MSAPKKGGKSQTPQRKAPKSKGKAKGGKTPRADAGLSRARAAEEKAIAEFEAAETLRVKKFALIAAFESCGRVTKACEAVGVERSTHYYWLLNDAEYKTAFDEADKRVGDLLEDEAYRRSVEGIDEPMIGRVGRDQDGVVTHVKRYSDRLLEILLKGRKPDRYKDRKELTGKDGGPITLRDLSQMSDDELDAELQRMEAEETRASQGAGK